jgi:hypothetical protein
MRLSRRAILLLILLLLAARLWPLRPARPPRAPHKPHQAATAMEPQPPQPATMTTTTANTTETAPADHPSKTPADGRQQAARSEGLVLRAQDDGRLEAIRQEAARLGLHVAGVIAPLRLLLLQGDREALATLALAFPNQVMEYDVPVFLPEPKRTSTASGTLGQPFGPDLLNWLGVDQSLPDRGAGVTVALLDTAVTATGSLSNTRLRSIELFALAREGDYAGHGQAVASLLAGQSEWVQGVSPGVNLLAIPVLDGNGGGSAFQVAQAIIAAVDAGAEVISMSLGTGADSLALRTAVEYAQNAGAVIVAATGNDGFNQLLFPAAYQHVIAVSAVSAEGAWADFSNHGPGVDIAAPGVGLYADWSDGEWVEFTGTSAGAPSVAGVIANLLAANHDLDAATAADIVLACADEAGAPGQDDFFGAGILNAARADNFNTPGIYDAAVTAHFLNHAKSLDDFVPVEVSAQNRGTETLPAVILTLTLDGRATTHQFDDVAPGEVVTATVTVDARQLADGKTATLTSTVETPGVTDTVPGNETRTSIVFLK